MEVWHRLTGVGAAVGNDPVSAWHQAVFLGKFAYDAEQMPNQSGVIFFNGVNGRDFLFWYHQKMRRRLRIDVRKRQTFLVFVNYVGRDFPVDDSAKNCLFHNR